MVRTQIQLTGEQFESLRRMAQVMGCSLAELVREGVDIILRKQFSATPHELRERARAISGMFRSGRKDLSRKHDEHLAEAYKT